ncbi:acetyltransferase [Acidovorax sp. D2M1]|uniref:Acetyltransferase n=1 Tax=Acidovorax benzenivorans TaxID=2987520 RepID=A0ABT5RU03_9BURK|nr:acetyltransferase [Acidovorax benzenivorans]MDD2177169.1 acetyltransferase [Acidovorax benzenivorans]
MPIEASQRLSLLIFGAGGHARVVADALQQAHADWLLVASDRNDQLCRGELLPGIPLEAVNSLEPWSGALHVAIGDNRAREKESMQLGLHQLVSVVHPRASVSPHSTVAEGCFVAAQAVIAPGVVLGRSVIVNHAAVVDHDCTVGAFTHIAPGAVLGGGAYIGSRVLIGSGATVLPGRVICDGAVIGSGAVVCHDIQQASTYIGVPARSVS